MKIKPEIKQRIIDTADTLLNEGIDEPTNAAVLERMGKGSLSHVSPVMREWRNARKTQISAALEIPADLKKTIETSLARTWAAASTLASNAVEKAQQEASERVADVERERDEALAEVERLEARFTEIQKTLKQKDQEIVTGKNDLEKERQNTQRITIENARLLAQSEERQTLTERLTNELSEARKQTTDIQRELVKIAKDKNK